MHHTQVEGRSEEEKTCQQQTGRMSVCHVWRALVNYNGMGIGYFVSVLQ